MAFVRGQRAFADGGFAEALDAFRVAYRLTGAPELLYNIGTSADRMRRDADALEAFRGYVREVPDASDRAAVEARIRVLERSVSEDAARRSAERPAQDRVLGANTEAPPRDEGGGGLVTKWWFWTIVGAAIVTGVAVGVALASSTGVAAPQPGDDGSVIIALRW